MNTVSVAADFAVAGVGKVHGGRVFDNHGVRSDVLRLSFLNGRGLGATFRLGEA